MCANLQALQTLLSKANYANYDVMSDENQLQKQLPIRGEFFLLKHLSTKATCSHINQNSHNLHNMQIK